MKIKLYIFFIFLFIGSAVLAQSRIKISGKVIDADNQGLELVSVRIGGTTQGTLTDLKGEYELTVASQDSIEIIFSCLGYRTEKRVLAAPQGNVVLNMRLYTKDKKLGEVVVTEIRKQTSTLQKIDAKDLRLMPDASGGSIESMLSTLAGVNSSNELSSQYSVRGGNFDENIVYVNGIEIYRPLLVRSGQQEGLSFINPDMVGSIGFSSGGYSAEYGDKMSSVLDITYKQPEAFEGAVSASFLGASAMIGHSTKRFSQLHGFRYKTNSTLLSSLDTKGEYDPSFFDYQTYLTYKFSPNWNISLLGNISNNIYNFTPQERTTKYGTYTSASQFKVYFDGQEKDKFQTFFGALSLNYGVSKYTALSLLASAFATNEIVTYDITGEYWLDELDMANNGGVPQTSGTLGYGTYHEHARNRLNASVFAIAAKGATRFGKNELKYGVNFQREIIKDRVREWELRDSAGYSLPHTGNGIDLVSSLSSYQNMQSNRFSFYAQDTYKLRAKSGFYTFTGGIRGSYWGFNKEFILSPRASVGYIPNFNDRLTFRFATGLYYQAPFYKELRDTVRTGENYVVRLNRSIKSQRSIHFVLGSDYSFRAVNRPFKFTAELYYKKLDNLIPYEVDNVRIWYSGRNESKCYSSGFYLNLFVQFFPGTDSWLSFSLMRTQKTIGGIKVPRPTEQRYSIALFFQDYVPRFPKYKFSLRAIWSDGLPVGAPRLGRQAGYFRTTPYRRVDIGASRLLVGGEDRLMKRGFFRYFKSIWIGLDVFNLLDISNVNSYYWVTDIYNHQSAVPNYLTMRQFNLRLSMEF